MITFDYWRCERIIQKASKTFYAAFSQLPTREQRRAVYAIYAFCRLADDCVDEHHDEQALNQFERDLQALPKETNRPTHFMWRALRDTWRQFPSTMKPYQLMIDGQRMDFHKVSYDTMIDLYGYCERVASSVGWMLNPVLAPGKAETLEECARSLGIAMQLTNILRDVGEDLRLGRIYLPTQVIHEHGYDMERLKNAIIDPSFIQVWETIARDAETHYERAARYFHLYPPHSQFVLRAAALLYREILTVCRDSHYDVFTKKNFVPRERKLALIEQLQQTIK